MYAQLQDIYGQARKAVGTEQTVQLLYTGTQRWIAEARAAMAAECWDQAGDRIHRAQAVLYELLAAVDRTAGGELADNLLSLYTYWIHRLSTGLTQRDVAPLDEVSSYLEDLAVAWDEAARKVRTERGRGGSVNGSYSQA